MPVEIERKFLVQNNLWKKAADSGVLCRQGYLLISPEKTIRVRIINPTAFLTIKGKSTGITRAEFEYEIPLSHATELLTLCEGRIVEKQRHHLIHHEQPWVIDCFLGKHKGLVLAEVELETEDQKIDLPDWLGQEVSTNPAYYNSNLALAKKG